MRRLKHNITNKMDWYEEITEIIEEDLEEFVTSFYPESTPKSTSTGFSMEPCPVCGHKDCCRISHGNMVNCFSCNWSGTYISSWKNYAMTIKGLSYFEAIKELEKHYHITFPSNSPGDMEKHRKQQSQQNIMKEAEKFYHGKLLNEGETINYDGHKISPYNYLINIRGRKGQTITDYQVGYSKDYIELKSSLIAAGYTEDEIKQAKIQIPEGVIVYFYHHPITRDIVRINVKNPFKVKAKFYDASGNLVESESPLEGWSAGDKIIYPSPTFTFKEPVILVEGENDAQAIFEKGFKNVAALGGNPPIEMLDILSKCEDVIYTFFDNDTVGEKYKNIINERFPDKVIKNIIYDTSYKDPDEYFKLCGTALTINELLDGAEALKTDKYKVFHDGNEWRIKDRTKSLEFVIKKRTDKGQLIGQANLYDANGKLVSRIDDTTLVKCKGQMAPFSFYLSDEIEHYFNTGIESLPFLELAERYFYSSRKDEIISMLAKRLYESSENADGMVSDLKRMFKGVGAADKIIDQILIEYNNFQNENVTRDLGMLPKMKIAQYYNMKNKDAYFYFTARKDDGDAQRAIPYLLKNDGSTIRLDLLRRKDEQCLIMIDNKYQMPCEVPIAVFDPISCSLQDYMVEQWKEGKIKDEDIEPKKVVSEIETWIKRFYYSEEENVYKTLALWVYGTYFYVMFGQYPYLYLNGEKGSGKTVLNNTLSMLSFNGRTVVETSEAALFRMAGHEGGTIMLDEQETLTSRSAGASSTFGPILKGGYQSGSGVQRYNMEKGYIETFDPYCPKVIANIMGLDDIIAGRCIPISTYRLTVSKDLPIEDPKYYMEHDQAEYKNLTSRICFSALKYFDELNTIYRDRNNLFESDNARVSQILTPILAIAKFLDRDEVAEKRATLGIKEVMGEYESVLMDYYKSKIDFYKKDEEDGTPEGIIKKVVKSVALELLGKTDKEYTIMSGRKYTDEITKNLDEGWFELNVLHFKSFIEESMPGEKVYSRHIPKWLRTCFNFDRNDIRRKLVHLENEDLIKELQGIRTTKVNSYRFYIKDIVKSDFLESKKESDKTKQDAAKSEIDVF